MTDAFLPLLEKSAAPVIAETDQQVIGGSGANGEVLGIQLTPGITTIAASAIDIQHVYRAIANAVQTIHNTVDAWPFVTSFSWDRRGGGFWL